MDVVLYMRYSSTNQTEQSIEGQNRVCTEFCERQGYNIVGRYIDRATSAYKDTEKRVEFNRMIKDSERGLWQGVVVYKLDRFARNRYDSATYKARLKKNGVKVISATENISDNPEGVILEAVLEGMAEFYSMELSQKINRGLRESASKGNVLGGSVPLGYRTENSKLTIYEPEAEIVREAFDLYAAGKTVKEICDIFNEKGYRTAKGARFNKNSFKSIFKNERYIGVYSYKDIRIEGGVPAIVNKDTFEEVQKRLTKNASAPSRGKANYLLSQKLFCGHCGALMIGESGTSKTGAVHNYYTCGTRRRHHTCDKQPLQKEWIETIVAEDAMNLIQTPEMIDTLAEMAVRQNEEDIANDVVIPAVRAELNDLQKRRDNLFRLVERGLDSDDLVDRIKGLEDQMKDAEKRLAAAQGEYIVLEKEHIVWWLSRFASGDIKDEGFKKDLIDLLINSVTVWDEPDGYYRITTLYNLVGNNSKTVRIKGDKGSVLRGNSPLLEYKPNSILFFGIVFGHTTKHRQG